MNGAVYVGFCEELWMTLRLLTQLVEVLFFNWLFIVFYDEVDGYYESNEENDV